MPQLSLWEMGSKPISPIFRLPVPHKPLGPPPSSQAGPSRPRTPVDELAAAAQDLYMSADEHEPEPEPNGQASTPFEPSEVSTLLSVALLQALISLQPSSFPMPASLLYSASVLPSRPAYIPKERREEVVIAKSDWKKLAKWIKVVAKEGLLRIKETKGEITVQGSVVLTYGNFPLTSPDLIPTIRHYKTTAFLPLSPRRKRKLRNVRSERQRPKMAIRR